MAKRNPYKVGLRSVVLFKGARFVSNLSVSTALNLQSDTILSAFLTHLLTFLPPIGKENRAASITVTIWGLRIKHLLHVWPRIAFISKRSGGFPGGAVVENPPANAGDTGVSGSIPGSRRCPGRGNGNLLQYSHLRNPMDRGARQATAHGVAKKSDMT